METKKELDGKTISVKREVVDYSLMVKLVLKLLYFEKYTILSAWSDWRRSERYAKICQVFSLPDQLLGSGFPLIFAALQDF